MDATTSAFIEATAGTAGGFFAGLFPLIYWFFALGVAIFFFGFSWRIMYKSAKKASRYIRK